MIKTYSVNNNEAILEFSAGKLMFKAAFTNGSMQERRGATFTTNINMQQILIENSKMFKNGIVKLDGAIAEQSDIRDSDGIEIKVKADIKADASIKTDKKTTDTATPPPTPQQEPTPSQTDIQPSTKTYEEPTSINEVRDILIEQGATKTSIRTKAELMAKAEELGLTFPNVVW